LSKTKILAKGASKNMIEGEVLLIMFCLGILEGYLMKIVLNHIKDKKLHGL
jgi:hypothetical protein